MRRQDTTHKGGGKGREKTRGGSSQDTHHYTKEKEKGKKTMTSPKTMKSARIESTWMNHALPLDTSAMGRKGKRS